MKIQLKVIDIFAQKNSKIFYSIIFLFLVIISGYVLISFLYPSISRDSGYYLKIGYDLSKGMSFFKDLNCSYSPMAIYIFSLPFYLNENIGLPFLHLYAFAQYPIIAVIFYKISRQFKMDRKICLFFTVLLITVNFILEGFHILLEPTVLLFQFIAILVLIKYETKGGMLFVSGFFVFFAFYTKQYGLFILPGMLFFILKKSKNTLVFLRNGMYFFAGFIFPLIGLLLYFYFFENIKIIDFLYQLFGISALKGDELITGTEYSIKDLWKRIGQFFIDFPFILLVFVFIFNKNKKKSNENWFVLLLLLGAFMTLKFAYYSHYFQLITPYVILVILTLPKPNLKYIFVLSIIFLVVSFPKLYKKIRWKKELYNEQLINIPTLNSNLKNHQNVYLQGVSPSYYFLCKYNSPNKKVLGYKFPSELTLKKITENIPKEDYIIIEQNLLKRKEFENFKFVSEFSLKNNGKFKNVVLLKKSDY